MELRSKKLAVYSYKEYTSETLVPSTIEVFSLEVLYDYLTNICWDEEQRQGSRIHEGKS